MEETNIKQLAKVLVGSRLHGLYNDASDYDYRGIHISPLQDVLSPYKTLKNTSWIEGAVDDTSYELADFCKSATKGNATILEVFFSDEIITTSPIHEEMKLNWHRFMDTDAFVMASRGYAHNQLNKMELFENKGVNGQDRTPKFVVAYIRVLWQCAEFLRTGKFECKMPAYLKDYMMDIKYNWRPELVPSVTEMFSNLQAEISKAWATAPKMKPDIEWIENFIYRAYIGEIK
jgi:predicted nucleotidyltransferase